MSPQARPRRSFSSRSQGWRPAASTRSMSGRKVASSTRKASIAIVDNSYAGYLAGPTSITLAPKRRRSGSRSPGPPQAARPVFGQSSASYAGNGDDWTTGSIYLWGACLAAGQRSGKRLCPNFGFPDCQRHCRNRVPRGGHLGEGRCGIAAPSGTQRSPSRPRSSSSLNTRSRVLRLHCKRGIPTESVLIAAGSSR
jgi:hypothetical protein